MSEPARDPELDALMAQIARDRGFGCTAYKESCMRRRLAVRMRARGVHTFGEYARLLAADVAEYDRLLDALTINVTKFYRNAETWRVLAERVLPEVWRVPDGLRAWSAGCASGEEAYTLAILLLERARVTGRPLGSTARIDATDVDVASLDRAAVGAYRRNAFEEMPADLVSRYFDGDDPKRVSAEVRRLVRFMPRDMLREPPPAPPYELIFCRNVVIYFDRPTQERVFTMFANALAPRGVLVLGKVETLFGPARDRLELIDTRERIYRTRA